MTLHVNLFVALTDHFANQFFFAKTLHASLTLLYVMTFESLTLTPFYLEILGFRKWIFHCFSGVFSFRFGLNEVKYPRIRLISLFLHFFQIFPVFSPGRDQLLRRAGLENISPRISHLHEFWIAGLESSI